MVLLLRSTIERENPNIKEINDRYAEATWVSREEDVKGSTKHTVQFGIAALKAPVVINGASIAALLAFVSANTSKLDGRHELISSCLLAFTFGFFLASISSSFAYLSQMFYTLEGNKYKKIIEHPYVLDLKNWQGVLGIIAHILTGFLVLAGYLFFWIGVVKFNELILIVIG